METNFLLFDNDSELIYKATANSPLKTVKAMLGLLKTENSYFGFPK